MPRGINIDLATKAWIVKLSKNMTNCLLAERMGISERAIEKILSAARKSAAPA